MSSGQRLPNRRPHEVFEFVFEGIQFRGGFGDVGDSVAASPLKSPPVVLPSGSVAGLREVWLTPDVKSGTAMEAMAQDLAVLASLALRHGCPVETIDAALAKLADGTPAGPLGLLFQGMREGLT